MRACIFYFCLSILGSSHLDALISNLLYFNTHVKSLSLGDAPVTPRLNPSLVALEPDWSVSISHKVGFANQQVSSIYTAMSLLKQKIAFQFLFSYPVNFVSRNELGLIDHTGSFSEYIVYTYWANSYYIPQTIIQNVWICQILCPDIIEYGVSNHLFYSKMLDYSRLLLSFDFGVTLRKYFSRLDLGSSHSSYNLSIYLSVLNIGFPVYSNLFKGTNTPTYKVGVEYIVFTSSTQKISLFTQYAFQTEKVLHTSFALEYALWNTIFIRGAYLCNDPLRRISIGLEVRSFKIYKKYNLILSYNILPIISVGLEHNVAISIKGSI